MLQNDRFSHALADRVRRPPLCVDGLVRVIQYGDFECDECGRVAAPLQLFRHRNEGVIELAYKHFPVSTLHRYAFQAAEAAECARAQGQFWPMHNLLIANQGRLGPRFLCDYAEAIGLDMSRFTLEMDAKTHSAAVRSHIYSGTLAGVRRAPAYFVDGILVDTTLGLRSLFEATSKLLLQRRGSGLLTD